MPKLKGSDVTRCRRTARAVLQECGVGVLPVDPEGICRKKGILYSHETDLPPVYRSRFPGQVAGLNIRPPSG